MTDAVEGHQEPTSNSTRTATNFHLQVALAALQGMTSTDLLGKNQEPVRSVECLNKSSAVCDTDSSAEKTKLVINNSSGINTDITIKRKKLETVHSFSYEG